jgi:hypothetical protein
VHVVRRQDALTVVFCERQLTWFAAHRQDDVAGLQRGLFAIFAAHDDLLATLHPAKPRNDVDLAGLHEVGDAARVARDHLVFVGQDLAPVDLHALHLNAHTTGILELVVDVRAVQHGLGGDAPAMQTSATQRLVFLHHRNLQAQRARPRCRNVASGTRANDDDIVACRHKCLLMDRA